MNAPVPWAPGPPPVHPIQPPVKRCNHLLHFILGWVTCGVWWVVWPFIALQVISDNHKAETWYVNALQQYNYEFWVWQQQNGR